MTPDELKSLPKGQFIVMKTGAYPMKVKLKLFFKWGITFEEPYMVPDKGNRPVAYAGKETLIQAKSGQKQGKKQGQQQKSQAAGKGRKVNATQPNSSTKQHTRKEREDDRP